MKKYTPTPIDTSDISLSKDLLKLTEKLAENVHENWAKRRLEEGWTLGLVRDDEKKTTPCLIPYSQLPEIEKSYDRNTAMETLKLIFKLGYTIEPKKGECENASE